MKCDIDIKKLNNDLQELTYYLHSNVNVNEKGLEIIDYWTEILNKIEFCETENIVDNILERS